MSHRKWVETVNELFIGIGTQTQTIPVQMCSMSSSWRIRPDSPLIVWSNAKAWSQQRAAARALRVLLKPWVLAWQGTDCCYKIVTKLYWYDVCIYIYISYIYIWYMYVRSIWHYYFSCHYYYDNDINEQSTWVYYILLQLLLLLHF